MAVSDITKTMSRDRRRALAERGMRSSQVRAQDHALLGYAGLPDGRRGTGGVEPDHDTDMPRQGNPRPPEAVSSATTRWSQTDATIAT